MIVEQRDYHVYTGKLPEVVRLYEEEGIPIQQEILGGLVGAFTTDDRRRSPPTSTHLARTTRFAEREERRARLQADQRWKDFLAKVQPLIHTQQNRILVPTSFSPLADERARRQGRDRHRRRAGDRRGDRRRARGRRARRSSSPT